MTARKRKIDPPPPVMCAAKVLFYAIKSEKVEFTNRLVIFVGGERLKEVPCLVICENLTRPDDYLLFFCDTDWRVLGVTGDKTIKEIKEYAEKGYKGISNEWIAPKHTDEAVQNYLEGMEREELAFWNEVMAVIRKKVASKVVQCCVCKRKIVNPQKNFGFNHSDKLDLSKEIPKSFYTDLRNVDFFHKECSELYDKERNIKPITHDEWRKRMGLKPRK